MPDSPSHYFQLFHKLPQGVAYCKILRDTPRPHDYVYLEVNEAFERFTGLKGVAGKRVSEVVPAFREIEPDVLEIYEEVAALGQPRKFLRYRKALGKWITVWTFCPHQDHFLAVFEASEQTPLAKALSESQALASSVISSMAEGVVIQDAQGHIETSNEAAQRILGLSAAEAVGRSVSEFGPVHEDGSPYSWEDYPARRVLQAGQPITNETMGVYRPDGSLVWLSVNARPILQGEGGHSGAVVVTFTDITARRQAEAERQQYLNLFQVSADLMVIADSQGVLLKVNPACTALLGYCEAELVSRRFIDLVHPDDRQSTLDELARQRETGFSTDFENRYLCKNGSLRWLSWHAHYSQADGNTYATARDIGVRKEFERLLAAKQSQLEELNRSLEERVQIAVTELRHKDQMLITQSRQAAMGEMIGHIAHQWRQPLWALGLVLTNLKSAWRVGQLDAPTVDKAVEDADYLLQEMSTIINDFRDFFKPSKVRAAFSSRAQIGEAVRMVEAIYRQSNITIKIEAGPDAAVFGVPNEYSQVVLNLLSNARQAIEEAKVAQGHVTLRLDQVDGFSRLAVSDNGGGVPEAILDKVFEPYFSTRLGGTGIGLFLSRQIIERSFGGRLEVRNVGSGAEFAVLTPLPVNV